ncbi:MAG TPA: hypothetical protein VGB70_06635 [Allosphingosinicella sp.]|jgi:hypothetical protein
MFDVDRRAATVRLEVARMNFGFCSFSAANFLNNGAAMRFHLLAICALTAFASPAAAAPVFLECTLDTKEGKQPWSISLNEEAGMITFSHPYATMTQRAIFTPDKVMWSEGDLSIDRTTLKFTRSLRLLASKQPPEVTYGSCAVSQKKRAF